MAPSVSANVREAIVDGVVAAANSSGNDLDHKDVTSVAAKVATQVVPVVLNATNNEPWYQSRVTWGVILAAFFTILKPFTGTLPISEEQTADIVNALATAGQVVGFGLTLYGRWKAKRPIGQ